MNAVLLQVASVAVAMPRVLAAFALLPFASRQWANRRVALPMAIAIALLVHPPLQDIPSVPVMALLAMKEAMLGVGLGLLIGRVFYVVSAAGALLDQQAGYTFGQTVNPTSNASVGPLENLFMALLTLLFFQGAGAFAFGGSLVASYATWPVLELLPTHGWNLDVLRDQLTGDAGRLWLETAMRLAAPAVALLLLADIALAIAARYAQQLNPFSMSLALKALIVALLLTVLLKGQLRAWLSLIHASLPAP